MDSDLDEFLSIVGTAKEGFRRCCRDDWTSGIKIHESCPIVISDNENRPDITFSIGACARCDHHYMICNCGAGLAFFKGQMICAQIGNTDCPRLDEVPDDDGCCCGCCCADDLEDDC